MINVPKKIFLNVGQGIEPTTDFTKLSEVTFCEDKIDEYDIEYTLSASIPLRPSVDWEIIKEAWAEFKRTAPSDEYFGTNFFDWLKKNFPFHQEEAKKEVVAWDEVELNCPASRRNSIFIWLKENYNPTTTK